MNDVGVCRLCSKNTKVIFNINLKAVSVCNSCANLISMQQVKWLCEEESKRLAALKAKGE